MTQLLTERLRAFAARWRAGRGYADEIYEIDTGEPSHVVLTVQMVEQSAAHIDALEATQAELVEALREIIDPIDAMQRRAEADGERIDGSMAYQLSRDVSYLKSIAYVALAKQESGQ